LKVSENQNVITGRFSMTDVLAYQPLLRKLRNSQNKNDKQLLGSLIKTAAARATMDEGL